jgi:hypothetical protein
VLIRIADGSLIPGLFEKGAIYEVIREEVYEFKGPKGRPDSFEVRDDSDTVIARGRRLPSQSQHFAAARRSGESSACGLAMTTRGARRHHHFAAPAPSASTSLFFAAPQHSSDRSGTPELRAGPDGELVAGDPGADPLHRRRMPAVQAVRTLRIAESRRTMPCSFSFSRANSSCFMLGPCGGGTGSPSPPDSGPGW